MSGPITKEKPQRNKYSRDFKCAGAGTLRINFTPWRCGQEIGPDIGVSWGQHGYTGGIISDAELARLRREIDQYFERKRAPEPVVK